ncbi:MAG TPA: Gfo/Idh/MocA family oxidoreductase [Blastocatellia bacterium]|nr:Gfo/Idh/MocA family oxidoreductase [Blastocatellia bacterium]
MAEDNIGRRRFLKTAAAGMAVFLIDDELIASAILQEPAVPGPPVKIGIVGAGQWGKEIAANLSRLPSARITALCDTYEPYLKRALEVAPNATLLADYRKLLESAEVEAVIVATPTHQHKEVAIAALQAGKHVYCECPLASSIDDAKAIAAAAVGTPKVKFQAGLQGRSNPLYRHVSQFVKSGVLGNGSQVIAQWNKKLSWRRVAPTPERERELNWRLSKQTSAGLAGEVGIHQLDLAGWYLNGLPAAATGFGAVTNWNDGRDVPDTIQCIVDYPNNVRMILSSTLTSSFSDSFTLFQGSNSSIILREKKGWLVKEADSPLLGWEVYARKEPVHNETGIALVADATKLLEAGKEPGKEGPAELTEDPLFSALKNFTRSIREGTPPAAGPAEGYIATAVALKANEAVASGAKISFQKAWFDLK